MLQATRAATSAEVCLSSDAALAPRKPPRDHRVDLVRGLALVVIFINHMPGNWLGEWTPRNFGFSDAAEIFVLLAGFAAALAYGDLVRRGDWRGLVGKALRRAGVLYGAHILTTIAALALFWSVITATGVPTNLDLIGMAPIAANPSTSLFALLIGGFQLSYFNILPLYVVLLALLPLMLALATRDLRLLALVSGSAWLATGLFGVALPSFSDYGSWFFNPFAWQALFAGGLALGLGHMRGEHVAYRPAVYGTALAYLAFAAWWRVVGEGSDLLEETLPAWLGSLQKPDLPLPRLLHVAALAYVVGHSRLWTLAARVPRGFVLIVMGRHSLPVFMTGSLLSMAGWLVSAEVGGGKAVETLIAALGITLMSALALHLDGNLAMPRLPIGPSGPRFSLVPVRAARRQRQSRMAR